MSEEWRQVPGYSEGVRASSWGRVCLPASFGTGHNAKKKYVPGPTYGCWAEDHHRFIIQNQKWLGGTKKIARLVCAAFHGAAPSDLPYVLHKDENSKNNCPDNLMWGTQKENLNAPGFLEYCRARTGENNPFVKGRR